MASGKKPVDPEKTFAKKIKCTPYNLLLDVKGRYDVYVHKENLSGKFHHKIVLRASTSDLWYITLELSKSGREVIAQSIMFEGKEENLEWKGSIEKTSISHIADLAMALLIDQGEYFLSHNNCQTFCNLFLKELNMEPYWTTGKKIGVGVFGFAATVLLAWVNWFFG